MAECSMENQSTLANIRTQQNLTWKCGATCFMPESETFILFCFWAVLFFVSILSLITLAAFA